jgi:hypothetical protein
MKIIKYLVLTAVCLSAINCSRASTEVAIATQENASSNAAAQNSLAAQSAAQQQGFVREEQTRQTAASSPEAVLKDLYRLHDQNINGGGASTRIISGENRTLLDKYFDKNLANLIWKDLTTHKNEIGVIDFDVFYDTQDPNIKNLTVGQSATSGGRATVPVSFTNGGAKQSINYSLVEQNGAWKITDIKYKDGTLLEYFKADAQNNTAATQPAAADNNSSGEEGSFEGTYRVGEALCTVKPIKMAFELKWAKGTGTMLFFYDGEGVLKYSSEDKGNGTDVFVFDDTSFTSGKFIRADGREMTVRKIK